MIRRQALVEYGAPFKAMESPVPVLKDGEILLRVSNCGLCHSDLHLIDGHFDLGEGRNCSRVASRGRRVRFPAKASLRSGLGPAG